MSVDDFASNQASGLTQTTDDFGTRQGGIGISFNLQACMDYNDFTQLFDRYKITGIKLKFLFQNNVSALQAVGNRAPLPLITYAFDADDANSPPTRQAVAVKQYAKEKILNGNRTFSVFYKPRLSKLVYNGIITSAYTSSKPEWLDCNNPSVPHFGVKLWLNNWYSDTDTSSMKLTIQPIYYLAMKDTQ